MSTNPENLVEIGVAHPQTIGVQRDR